MTTALKKFGLLMWKNWILQKRHKIQTVAEVLLPLAFTAILVIVRDVVNSEYKDEGRPYEPFSVSELNGTRVPGGYYILYTPNGGLITTFMEKLRDENFPEYELRGSATEGDLLIEYDDLYETFPFVNSSIVNVNPVLAAVIFPDMNSASTEFPFDIKYTLRFPATQHNSTISQSSGEKPKWYTELTYPYFQLLGPREEEFNEGGEPAYWGEGFIYLQWAIDKTLGKMWTDNEDDVEIKFATLKMSRYPYPAYIDDVFLVALQGQLPLIMILSFIYSVINITKSVVHEKERRLKESMKMMGLPNWLHWTAWFTKSFIFLFLSIILMTVFLKMQWYSGNDLAVLTFTNWLILFLFLLAFIFTVICFSFLISTFFSTANSAATATGVLFFLTYFPYIFLQPRYSDLSKSTKIFSSLLSNTGMAFGCQIIAMFEGTKSGVQWSTLGSTVTLDDDFTLLDVIIILFFDGVLYLLLALYIEAVWPGDFGVPMPWYFPFTKWYWCGTPRNSESYYDSAFGQKPREHNSDSFEEEPNGKAGVRIVELTKVFNTKVAVNKLSINMYENQITALLGHNGAGKTTTMSMLTGLFPPTSGTALLNGYDIREDIKAVRSSLGLCPQHDVLFDELTVEEHLRFFCLMKGLEGNLVDSEVDRMLKALNLENKRHAQSQTLSGGMKRKLSVGIALCGGSKVVLLDEPTSGMDPGARRGTWDLLQSEKKNRTLILSTHFMEEADLLGDRIAIMAEGQMQCCGSSLFLKKKYGGGYHLIIVKHPHCVVENITEVLRRKIPEIEVEQNVGAELSYSLPDQKSHLFPEMFEELEKRKQELGIASYGASITTMEEVFMRVGQQADAEAHKKSMEEEKAQGKSVNVSVETLQTGSQYKLYENEERNTGMRLVVQQLLAMMVKKTLYGIRNKALLIAQTIIPVAFLIITLIMIETLPGSTSPPSLPIGLTKFSDPVTVVSCNGNLEICRTYKEVASLYSKTEEVEGEGFEPCILEKSVYDLATVNSRYIVGLEANKSGDEEILTGYFNNQPYHGAPVTLNFMTTAILRSLTDKPINIAVTNHPMPLTVQDQADNLGSAQSSGFNIGFNVAFGMSFLASSFVVFLIKERMTKAKHLQFVSGVKFPIFWAASFIFDVINYIIPCLLLMIVLLAFQDDDFKEPDMQGYLFILFVLYGWAIIPQMYLFSFAFSVPSSGFTRMVMLNVFTGMATILAITILQIPQLNLLDVAEILDWIFMLFPNYNLGIGIVQLSTNRQLKELCPALLLRPGRCEDAPDDICCKKYNYGYLDWNPAGIGRNLLFLFLTGLICFTALFISEAKLIEKIRYGRGKQQADSNDNDPLMIEDTDVTAEKTRIRNTNLKELFDSDNLVLRDLTKLYKNFLAVDKLCLGVQRGECFGLLGVNGAGKTTTFKMLTGDLPISAGDAFVHSNSVKSEIKEVQRNVGYCPQFDAIIEELTGRETIRLFARLRGVHEASIDKLVDLLAANLLFSEHIDKQAGAYSGGNKRKLSTALALVGNPPMVFLDEPTTGMDPMARRHLWNAISNVREAGTSIVLTSHSMEECEALCSRLSIMVNGRFRCLGSPQHLKNKFGEGYTLIAQIANRREETVVTRKSIELARRTSSVHGHKQQDWERDLQPLKSYIEGSFPGCQLKDIHPGYVQYHTTDQSVTWGQMFQKMEVAKAQFNLEAYSVGQTTLEQVFLNFTKAQINGDAD